MSESAAQTQTEHAPGSFCWIELATTDGPGAKKFYGELFGWDAHDSPIGPDQVYTLLRLDGKDVGALYQKGETMKDVPPNWASYISVTSADETVAKAQALGGNIIQGAFDVMEVGRMAVISDPTGAVFCIWQPKVHKGVGVKGEPNSLTWNELLTTDTAKAGDFYTKLFGWVDNTHGGQGHQYTEFMNGDTHAGGMMKIEPHMGPIPPNWGIYFAVEDVDAAAEKAKSLGANLIVPPMDIETVGRFSTIRDPQGAVFSIIKLSSHHEENKA